MAFPSSNPSHFLPPSPLSHSPPLLPPQFFPDFNELKRAKKGVFDASPFQLDCLTRPSAFSDLGLGGKVNVSERVVQNDAYFVAAYPYFNVNGRCKMNASVNCENGISDFQRGVKYGCGLCWECRNHKCTITMFEFTFLGFGS